MEKNTNIPIKIGAIGGLDENGKNCFIIEVDNDIFVIEAGLKYPDKFTLGIDYIVPDFTYLKDGEKDYVRNEIAEIKKACGNHILKVIIETCLLTDEEKVLACQLAKDAGADFVKTSTGFSTHGATKEDVALMRKTVGKEMGVKAAGGVRNKQDLEDMVNAGATRIGTSRGVELVK